MSTILRPRNTLPTLDELKSFCGIDPETGCWLWGRCRDTSGYGLLTIGGKIRKVHRLAFLMANGNLDDNACVLHKCDTPACINPNHLFQGTKKDNVDDCIRKNRHTKGHKVGVSKLTEDQVLVILESSKSTNVKTAEIARRFGVSTNTIRHIIKGLTWSHIK